LIFCHLPYFLRLTFVVCGHCCHTHGKHKYYAYDDC
jgi:hypothetical protein